MLGWLGNIDPDEFYYAQHRTGGTFNFHKYSNPQPSTRCSTQAATQTDQSARKETYDQAAKQIVDDVWYLYLYNPDVVQGGASRSTATRSAPTRPSTSAMCPGP